MDNGGCARTLGIREAIDIKAGTTPRTGPGRPPNSGNAERGGATPRGRGRGRGRGSKASTLAHPPQSALQGSSFTPTTLSAGALKQPYGNVVVESLNLSRSPNGYVLHLLFIQ